MGYFLNSSKSLKLYKNETKRPYFVDKTSLLEELIPLVDEGNNHVCITRPRRFGKSVMAAMVAAFFTKGLNSSLVFDNMNISYSPLYRKYINRYNVIYINFIETANLCNNYNDFITEITEILQDDLHGEFPTVRFRKNGNVVQDLRMINEQTDEEFIFVFDEWDCIFHKDYITNEDRRAFIGFLAGLTKDTGYVSLSYMTGILPIAKYSSGSTINNFKEYTMVAKSKYSNYFGFTDSEVDELYKRYLQITEQPTIKRKDLEYWYDGYQTPSGDKMYNPRSVVFALTDNQIASYWTETGSYGEIANYIIADVDDIKGCILRMIAGEEVEADVSEYTATTMSLDTKDNILSAMVVYGFLSYKNGFVKIPNKELLNEFKKTIQRSSKLESIREIEMASLQLLEATLNCDEKAVEDILGFIHITDSPHKVYRNEAELSAVIKLAYLAARGQYEVNQEDQAGKGCVDFIFYPKNKVDDGIIIELKADKTPKTALQQIKDRDYAWKFIGKVGESPKTTGRIIMVGINCPYGTKEHQCEIEVVNISDIIDDVPAKQPVVNSYDSLDESFPQTIKF